MNPIEILKIDGIHETSPLKDMIGRIHSILTETEFRELIKIINFSGYKISPLGTLERLQTNLTKSNTSLNKK